MPEDQLDAALPGPEQEAGASPSFVTDATPSDSALPKVDAPASELKAEQPMLMNKAAKTPPAESPALIGPRWFSVTTPSQAAKVNLLLRNATADLAANEDAVRQRFIKGHGIRFTPHQILVNALPDDYIPLAADLDHDDAIEAALAAQSAEAADSAQA